MWFDSVVEVDESGKGGFSVLSVLEVVGLVPHFHERSDDPLRFAVGLWAVDSSEFLADAVLFAQAYEGVILRSLILLAVV